MPTTNLFLDFDNTQVKGNLHNAIASNLKKKNFPKGYKFSEFIDAINNPQGIPEEVKTWLDRVIEKENIEFYDAKLLAEKVKSYKDANIQVHVLSASSFGGAINYMLEKKGLSNLFNEVITVHHGDGSQNKTEAIQTREEKAKKEGVSNDLIISIFADDSKNS